MKKLLLSGLFVVVFALGVSAQKDGYDPVKAPFGQGEDSVKCLQNLSLTQTSVNAGDYKNALPHWIAVYENCPAASKNTFIYGPRIYKALHENETDKVKRKEMVDKVMEIYDNRMKYFTDDAKGTILTYKAYDYMAMMGEETDPHIMYAWLGEAIKEMKSNMVQQDAYSYYMAYSLTEYLKDNKRKDMYIEDYFTITGYVDEAIERATANNDTESVDYLGLVKEGIVQGFVSSGAGDCKTLGEYYADKVEPNKENKAFLTEVINALGSVGCSSSDLYFTASEYLYRLEPTASAAIGLASRCLRDKDYENAIKYYSEAASMETDKKKSSDYMMQLAGIFSNQRNYSRARQAAYDALEHNPNNGSAYILIGQLYATTAQSIFPEAEKRGLVFCAAVDKMNKAKSVDPSVTAEANRFINQYSGYYMDVETAFMMGIKAGETIYIPGWIGESTTVRLK